MPSPTSFEHWWLGHFDGKGNVDTRYAAMSAWNAALRMAAGVVRELDCAHRCGVGHEVAQAIEARIKE